MSIRFRNTVTRSSYLVIGLLLIGATGCGSSGPPGKPSGNVTVAVSFGGQPVTEGLVSLQNSSGDGGGAPLNSSGVASFPKISQGDYIVTITPPVVGMAAPDPGKKLAAPKDYANIPPKFRRTETSTLKATVKVGANEFKFDLQQ